MAPEQGLTVRESQDVVRAEDFLPLLTIQQAVDRKRQINEFIGKVLTEGIDGDYGIIPGSKKKVLLKPGAEKLCSIFGMSPTYSENCIIEDWTGAQHGGEPLFHYSYRCQLSRGGKFMGEAIGSCNSWESKYRYRWVPEDVASQREDFDRLPKRGGTKTMFEPTFALDKAETTGKYGKPAEYWEKWRAAAESGEAKPGKKMMGGKEYNGYFMTVDETQYRIPNPEIADVINTCQKIAQKRALVSCVLVVTNCSDSFTPDMEDFQESEPPQERPRQTQSRQEPPPITPTVEAQEVPDEVRAMWAEMVNIKGICAVFSRLKERMQKLMGASAGDAEYYRILQTHGQVEHANQLRKLSIARTTAWKMLAAIQLAEQLHVSEADVPQEFQREPGDE